MDSAHPAAAVVALEAAEVVVTVAVDSVVATAMVVAGVAVAAASVAAAVEAVEAVIKPTFPADLAIGNAPSLTAETLTSLGEMNVTNVKPLNPKVLEVTLEAEGVVDSVAAAAEVAVEAVASVVVAAVEEAQVAEAEAEIAAAIHSSLTSSLGEGASFKYVLKEMGKSVGDEHAEFWDKAAAEVAEAKGGAPAAMDVAAGNT